MSGARAKVKHLEAIYKLIESHLILNTDKFVTAKDETVRLSPRGNVSRLGVEKELRECLVWSLLPYVQVAHQIPLYHRDIQWKNI